MTLEDFCREVNNWFDVDRCFGTFTIADGVIDLSEIDVKDGQYFRVVGSIFNDGVYRYPAEDLIDEEFDGAVWPMAVPQAVLSLVDEISAWETKYGGAESAAASPFMSESFGGYSYSKSSGSSNNEAAGDGDAGSWQRAYASRLNRWRKIRP